MTLRQFSRTPRGTFKYRIKMVEQREELLFLLLLLFGDLVA